VGHGTLLAASSYDNCGYAVLHCDEACNKQQIRMDIGAGYLFVSGLLLQYYLYMDGRGAFDFKPITGETIEFGS